MVKKAITSGERPEFLGDVFTSNPFETLRQLRYAASVHRFRRHRIPYPIRVHQCLSHLGWITPDSKIGIIHLDGHPGQPCLRPIG